MIGAVKVVQGVLLGVFARTTWLQCGIVSFTGAGTALAVGYTRMSCGEAFRALGCAHCGSKDVSIELRKELPH